MIGKKVWGKIISLCIVLMGCFLLTGFGENYSVQGEQSPVSFYENLLISGERAFLSGEYEKAVKVLEIAAFGLFFRKSSAAKAYVLLSLSYYHLNNRDSAGKFLVEATRLLSEEELKKLDLNIDDTDRGVLESLIQDLDIFRAATAPSVLAEDPRLLEKPPPTPEKKVPERKNIPESVDKKTAAQKKTMPKTVDERIAQLIEIRTTKQPEQLKEKAEIPSKKEMKKKPVQKRQEKESQIEGLEELFILDQPVQEKILSEIRIQKGTDSLDVRILFQPYTLHQIFEITDMPPKRIVIDIHNITGIRAGRSIDINDFGITSIRTGMFKANVARVVFDAEGDLPAYKLEKIEDGLRLAIEKLRSE